MPPVVSSARGTGKNVRAGWYESPFNSTDKSGRRIGVNKGSVQETFYLRWAEQHGIEAELVELTTTEAESQDMLGSGELDACVTLNAYGDPDKLTPVCKVGSSDCVLISSYRYNNISRLCKRYKLTAVSTGIGLDYSFAVAEGETELYSILAKIAGLVPASSVNAALTHYITESAYTENADQVIRVVEELRRKGFTVEMDDFGTGYSSLSMLSAMPIDVLKMDGALIRNMENNEKDIQLVALILGIARGLKIPVVAEGVETEAQLKLLKEQGCDLMQGFYFSRPLPAPQFEEKLLKKLDKDMKS